MSELKAQLEELKRKLELLEESVDPVDEVMISIKEKLRKRLSGGQLPELNEEKAAKTLKALANPDRIRILKMLSKGPMSFNEIKESLRVESPTVSHHLKLLLRAKMVRKGDRYEITPDGRLFLRLLEIITALEEVEE